MQDTIRKATNSDLKEVLAWLEEEENRFQADEKSELERGFWCHKSRITEQQAEGSMFVLCEDDKIIGFHSGGLDWHGLSEIRPGYRMAGHGRKLAEHAILQEQKTNKCLLTIDLSSLDAARFWRKMGFQTIPPDLNLDCYGNGDVEVPRFPGQPAFLCLTKTFSLDPAYPSVPVTIGLFPEEKQWMPSTSATRTLKLLAARLPNGKLELPNRVILWSWKLSKHEGNMVVEIAIDGKQVYCDKVRYPEAENFGVERAPCETFFIDRITETNVGS